MPNFSRRIINSIVDKLVKDFNPIKIYISGSNAWGSPDVASDLDLFMILKDSNLSRLERGKLARESLKDFNLPIDIIVRTEKEFEKFSQIPKYLPSRVKKQGILIYEKNLG